MKPENQLQENPSQMYTNIETKSHAMEHSKAQRRFHKGIKNYFDKTENEIHSNLENVEKSFRLYIYSCDCLH